MERKQKLTQSALASLATIVAAAFKIISGIIPSTFVHAATPTISHTEEPHTATDNDMARETNDNSNNDNSIETMTSTTTSTMANTSQSSNSTITVATILDNGSQISGMQTTLSQNGVQLQSAFSPATFAVNGSEQTYQVTVSDFGGYIFNHWSDGITSRTHDVIMKAKASIMEEKSTSLSSLVFVDIAFD
jgi:hypothetical protein